MRPRTRRGAEPPRAGMADGQECERMKTVVLIREENVTKIPGYNRYNGGWLKKVTGLDKTRTNGYSILGEFVKTPFYANAGDLVLDCSIGGSRKHQVKAYHLCRVEEDGSLTMIEEVEHSREWAVNFWDAIEKNLPEAKGDDNPLAVFSDEEILAEARRRGLVE